MVGVGNVSTELTALGTIETAACHGVTTYHIVGSNLVDEVLVCDGYIRGTFNGVPLHVLCEGAFHRDVAYHIAPSIVVE